MGMQESYFLPVSSLMLNRSTHLFSCIFPYLPNLGSPSKERELQSIVRCTYECNMTSIIDRKQVSACVCFCENHANTDLIKYAIKMHGGEEGVAVLNG